MPHRTVFYAILSNNMDLFNSFDKHDIIRKDIAMHLSPLFFACVQRKLDFVKRIVEIKKEIEQKPIISLDSDEDMYHMYQCYYTCLMKSEDIEIIKYLISEGANINYKDKYGNNALIMSTSINIVKFYLENGLDINSTNIFNVNLLNMPVSTQNIHNFLFLIKKKIIINETAIRYCKGIYKIIIDNPFNYYMRENIKDYFLNMNVFNFLYEILNDDIASIIYANPLKIYNGKFNIGKDDIRYFLNKIKSYKGVQSQKYKKIFISLIK